MSIKIKVLIVEDEPILSQALSIQLTGNGFSVSTADNGVDGLKLIKKENPAVVLLDLLMPVMDGFEVLKELKASNLLKRLEVIVLTNLGQEEDEKKAKALGARYFFVKSALDLDDLTALVKKITSHHKK